MRQQELSIPVNQENKIVLKGNTGKLGIHCRVDVLEMIIVFKYIYPD